MTDGGPSGGDGGRDRTNVPATPGELPNPPTPQPPGQSPQPASSFPGQEAATMRLIPTLPKPGVTPPPSMAERHIGKYVVKRELGRGGMGAVYLAEQTGLGREVAIKELIPSAAADPIALKRFLQEAQVMARTSHPNLVQVYDMEQIQGANYIVLEFVRGKSLRDWLNRGAIPPPQVFAVMHGVLQALDYAHRHAIVHRDMKPENVLLSDEGDVKVADFGIARLTDDSAGPGSTATKTGTTVGTPQYMSPEQVASSKVDGRSDLYSAGIMFYELIVGEPPFTASEADGPFTLMAKHVQAPPRPPSVLKPGLDPQLEEIILKSLSKRPEDRYQNGQEFDESVSGVADRLCPGWQRSLDPGADLSKMVPRPTSTLPPGTITAAAPPTQYASPPPIQAVYNPTPPVKPVVKKASGAGCMSLLVITFGPIAAAAILIAVSH
ncbi:MAG: serine/threonine protein kinase [Chloroflexi bacterium]|nr:MAG: serine/threonine protein kinase [Chloroflexota bacterium]TMF00122.1 MAG: serine/threonine protein kinase [Chloroflexota bacterium]